MIFSSYIIADEIIFSSSNTIEIVIKKDNYIIEEYQIKRHHDLFISENFRIENLFNENLKWKKSVLTGVNIFYRNDILSLSRTSIEEVKQIDIGDMIIDYPVLNHFSSAAFLNRILKLLFRMEMFRFMLDFADNLFIVKNVVF